MQGVFSQYHGIIPVIRKKKNDQYFLITLDPIKRETTINGYKKEDSQRANAEYTRLETTLRKPSQVVLVQVSSVNALQRAYPNYFLDTQDFLRELSAITGVSIWDLAFGFLLRQSSSLLSRFVGQPLALYALQKYLRALGIVDAIRNVTAIPEIELRKVTV